MRIVLILYLFALSLCSPALADDSSQIPSLDTLVAQARQLQLSEHSQWLSLVHYYPGRGSSQKVFSHVNDERFFLSPDGSTDSKAELDATLSALLFDTRHSGTKLDPRCRFVERERWLREQLKLPASSVPSHCVDYHAWFERIRAHSLTLIFPAAYLNSPSSMFGHTLLRFDPEDIENNSSWLSYSLNFAANVGDDQEYSFGYAFKGIAGGYQGKFNVVPYFQKIKEYGAIENRDIWEYRLDLTPAEVRKVLNHAWELRDISFKYYFFRENCSFRLLELLDYARPELRLAEQFPRTAIPASTVRAVVNSGLVSDVTYRSSTGADLQYNARQIPTVHRHWIEKIANDPDVALSDLFMDLEETLRRALLTTANQLLTYNTRRAEATSKGTSQRFRMLQLMSAYPAKPAISAPAPSRPEIGHDTRQVSLGVGDAFGRAFVEAEYRLTYHDILDNVAGYLPGAEIVMANVVLRQYEKAQLQLDAFDFIRIRSLNSRFAFFKSIAWEVDSGLKRDELLEDNKLSAHLKGFAGKSFGFGESGIVFMLAGASVNGFHSGENTFYANAHLKTGLMQQNALGTASVELTFDSLQHTAARTRLSVRQNVVLAKNHAIRGEVVHSEHRDDSNTSARVQYRFYF